MKLCIKNVYKKHEEAVAVNQVVGKLIEDNIFSEAVLETNPKKFLDYSLKEIERISKV